MRYHYRYGNGSWGSLVVKSAKEAIAQVTASVPSVDLIQIRNVVIWTKPDNESKTQVGGRLDLPVRTRDGGKVRQ